MIVSSGVAQLDRLGVDEAVVPRPRRRRHQLAGRDPLVVAGVHRRPAGTDNESGFTNHGCQPISAGIAPSPATTPSSQINTRVADLDTLPGTATELPRQIAAHRQLVVGRRRRRPTAGGRRCRGSRAVAGRAAARAHGRRTRTGRGGRVPPTAPSGTNPTASARARVPARSAAAGRRCRARRAVRRGRHRPSPSRRRTGSRSSRPVSPRYRHPRMRALVQRVERAAVRVIDGPIETAGGSGAATGRRDRSGALRVRRRHARRRRGGGRASWPTRSGTFVCSTTTKA